MKAAKAPAVSLVKGKDSIDDRITKLEVAHKAALAELEAKHRRALDALEDQLGNQADTIDALKEKLSTMKGPLPGLTMYETLADLVRDLVEVLDSGRAEPVSLRPIRDALRATGRYVEPRLD